MKKHVVTRIFRSQCNGEWQLFSMVLYIVIFICSLDRGHLCGLMLIHSQSQLDQGIAATSTSTWTGTLDLVATEFINGLG